MSNRGCIFDFDGTLFDSMSIWDTAGGDFLKSAGVTPRPDLYEHIHTTSLYQAAVYMQKAYALPLTVDEIMAGINKTVEDFYFYIAQPKPFVEDFLRKLAANGIPMCIATATDRYQVQAALRRCGLDGYFKGIFTCTEVGHGKDEPHIFEAALACLGTEKANTYVFEDACYAAGTAHKAGFPIAAVFDSHELQQRELRALATYFFPDYRDMQAFFT